MCAAARKDKAKPAIKLTRENAMDARPLAVRIHSREERPDGGAKVTVGIKATKVQRFLLRLPEIIKRQFVLDAYGLEVLDMCDGHRSVRHIIKKFAKEHQVNHNEAHQAVTSFLHSMMKKGLIVMVMPESKIK